MQEESYPKNIIETPASNKMALTIGRSRILRHRDSKYLPGIYLAHTPLPLHLGKWSVGQYIRERAYSGNIEVLHTLTYFWLEPFYMLYLHFPTSPIGSFFLVLLVIDLLPQDYLAS
jgi:hypothetical protein